MALPSSRAFRNPDERVGPPSEKCRRWSKSIKIKNMASIEKEIFERAVANRERLIAYGFRPKGDLLFLERDLPGKDFGAEITIDKTGDVNGRLFDLSCGEEYQGFRYESGGEFAATIREAYILLLEEIRKEGFDVERFLSQQANEIARHIESTYCVQPEFLWKKWPGYAVFRNTASGKWFGIIMNIDKARLIPDQKGVVEILNLKLDEDVASLLEEEGFFPAYHQNKKSWVTILLDGTVSESKIFTLIEKSFNLSNTCNDWLIPANPRLFDVISAFEKNATLRWHRFSTIQKGDYVYIYYAEPYASILFRCLVEETELSREGEDAKDKWMLLRLVKDYPRGMFNRERLASFSVKAVRGPRRVPKELALELEKT